MGVWAWFDRWDARALEVPGLADDVGRHRGGPWHAEGIHLGRVWHALHVALTGESEGGALPLGGAVWGGGSLSGGTFCHDVETVREIAEALAAVDGATAVETLCAARELGVFVYAEDLVHDDTLRAALDEVRRFYAAAAAGGQIVTGSRG